MAGKKKVVAKNVISERKPDKLYYVKGKDVVEADMNRKGAKKGHKSCVSGKR